MAPTPTIAADLTRRGFARVRLWTRGVNHALYRPRTERALDLPRPIFLSVGRVAVEKNLEALLGLDLPGSTVIVGDGPARRSLERRYRHAHFLGAKYGEALADIYASADVFVFPSRTDTFGIVLIEAMASGLPVAAFPAPGPIDVVAPGAGVLDEDLRAACLKALTIPREKAREHSLRFTWKESARQFLDNIEMSRSERRQLAPRPSAVGVARAAQLGEQRLGLTPRFRSGSGRHQLVRRRRPGRGPGPGRRARTHRPEAVSRRLAMGRASSASPEQARSTTVKISFLRFRIGCSIRFQDSHAQSKVGGKAMSVICHQLPTPGKRCAIVCSTGKWNR